MKIKGKDILPIVLIGCVLMSLGLKNNDEQTISLKIEEHYGMPPPGTSLDYSPKTIVEINGKTKDAEEFLSGLWQRNRPLFKDAQMHNWGPDAGYTKVIFIHGKEILDLGSWHRGDKPTPNSVVTSHGIEALQGRKWAEVLANDEKWYLDFRKGFDAIVEESLKFQKEHAELSSSEVKQARMSQAQVIEVAKKFAQEKGKNLFQHQEPEAFFDKQSGAWLVGFSKIPPTPGAHFSVVVDDESGKPLELYGGL
ncbi:MAG: hypothetical protein WCJ71_10740 [Candidatus Omnitrophota bacterium]